MSHTSGPWRAGKVGDSVVSDAPVEGGPDGADAVDYYGGHLIAESVAPCNRALIAAAPDLYAAIKGSMEYLDGTLGPCDEDCECLLHDLHTALRRAEGRS